MEKKRKSLSEFINFKRFTFIIPAIILALAMLVFAIWGVNNGLEYKDSYTYNIYFNTTISSKDFNNYKDIITDTITAEANGKYSVVVTKANDDITSQCKVNVFVSNDNNAVENLTEINKVIETKLNQVLQKNIIRISDVELQKAETYGNALLTGVISILIFMAIAFVYFWIRFELRTALSSIIIAPYVSILMLSIMTLFRLPFTASFMLPVIFGVAIGYIMFTVVFDYIRKNLENKTNSQTNEQLVYTAIKSNSSLLIALMVSLSLIFVLLTFLFNLNTLLICITLLFALVIAFYSAIILPCTMWSLIYNKEKDNKLKAKLELLESRENKKNSKIKKDENNAVV